MKKGITLGIIGTGGMANLHASQLNSIRGCKVVAACDIDPKRVTEFAKKYDIPQTFTDAQKLVNDDSIDAVSIVTPDPSHAPLSIMALKAGKHVMCEKPLATNYANARKMVAAAKKAGTINMVNLSYRGLSALHRAKKMIEQGKLGEIRHVHAHYLQSWLLQDAWGHWRTTPAWLWRQSKAHGSKGVLGDLGVHILDFATYPVGDVASLHCKLKNFKKAKGNRIDKYKLDANDTAIITAEFKNDAQAVIHTSRTAAPHVNSLKLNIHGTAGTIEIDSDRSMEELEYWPIKKYQVQEKQTITTKKDIGNIPRFIKAIKTGNQEQPDFQRGADIQKLLDACFESDAKDKTISV